MKYLDAFRTLAKHRRDEIVVTSAGNSGQAWWAATRDTEATFYLDASMSLSTMRLGLISPLLYPLAGVVLIIAVWALACWFFNIPTVVLPSPDKVLRSLIIRSDLLLSEGWITLKETLYGFVLALVIGLPLAVAVANSRPLNLMFYPLLIALQSVPKVDRKSVV